MCVCVSMCACVCAHAHVYEQPACDSISDPCEGGADSLVVCVMEVRIQKVIRVMEVQIQKVVCVMEVGGMCLLVRSLPLH